MEFKVGASSSTKSVAGGKCCSQLCLVCALAVRENHEPRITLTLSNHGFYCAVAIAKNVRVFEHIALLAVGPSSVNQCIKV